MRCGIHTCRLGAVIRSAAMRIELDPDEAAYLRGRIVDDSDPLANRVWLKLAQASEWTQRCGICEDPTHDADHCGVW